MKRNYRVEVRTPTAVGWWWYGTYGSTDTATAMARDALAENWIGHSRVIDRATGQVLSEFPDPVDTV